MSPNYTKAKDAVKEILSEYQISESNIPVPIYEIAESKGLTVKIVSMPPNLMGVSGFLDPEKSIVYVNAEDVPARQTFTVAHELGHFLLKHDPKKLGVLLRFPELNGKDPEEKEANCFAANLLVPEDMLKQVKKKFSLGENDVPLLAQMFGVSNQVMEFRLKTVK